MKRITLLLIISAVILLFSSCATLQSLTQPQYGEVTITYQDGDVITYLLPPEFPELNQEQMEYVPVSVGYVGYAIYIRQVIGDDKYAILITNDNNAEIFGSASIIGENEKDTWWIYTDGKPSDKPCSYEEFETYAIQFVAGTLKPNPGV